MKDKKAAPPKASQGPGSIFQNICLLILTCVICFAVLEISARVYLVHFVSENDFLHYASLKQLEDRYQKSDITAQIYSPHRYLGYYLTPNYRKGKNRHNSLGYRGEEIVLPKPPGEFRIVCLGGSTTYTTGVKDYRMSYPYLLEKDLVKRGYDHVKVINAGTGSWASWESLINFEIRVLDLDPDMVIYYEAANDIMARLVWPPEVYKGDNSGRRTPNASNLFMPSIFEYSTLLRILMIRAEWIRPHGELERSVDKTPGTYYGYQFILQKTKGEYPKGIFQKTSALEMLKTNKPIYYKRNLGDIAAIAKERGIKVFFATFAYSPLFTEEPKASSEEFIYGYHDEEEAMREISKEQGIPLFDFGALFPKDRSYYTDGIHANEKGSAMMAQLFADYIDHEHLIPRS